MAMGLALAVATAGLAGTVAVVAAGLAGGRLADGRLADGRLASGRLAGGGGGICFCSDKALRSSVLHGGRAAVHSQYTCLFYDSNDQGSLEMGLAGADDGPAAVADDGPAVVADDSPEAVADGDPAGAAEVAHGSWLEK